MGRAGVVLGAVFIRNLCQTTQSLEERATRFAVIFRKSAEVLAGFTWKVKEALLGCWRCSGFPQQPFSDTSDIRTDQLDKGSAQASDR